MTNNIVKARGRQGTKSLDLTIPVKISEEYDINAGDLFKVTVEQRKDKVEITYELIYKNI